MAAKQDLNKQNKDDDNSHASNGQGKLMSRTLNRELWATKKFREWKK